MKYAEHLMELTYHFTPFKETRTTIADVAGLLHCSDRHAKTVMGYLHDNGYIRWVTEQGRGKRPRITLLISSGGLLVEQAKGMVKDEKFHDAFAVAKRLDQASRSEFETWFMNYLEIAPDKSDAGTLDVLRYPFYETNLIMDPLHMISRHDSHMVQQIFDRLVEFNSATGMLEPKIAHHWESPDGKRWTFYLRKGVTFHHGRKLTSHDVKVTFERLKQADVAYHVLESIETPTETVVQFKLRSIDYLFPRFLSSMRTSIVPADSLAGDPKTFRTFPVGCGPFRLRRHNADMIRLDVFEDYYGERPWLDRVEIIPTPSAFLQNITHPLMFRAPESSAKKSETMEEGASFITFNCRENGPVSDETFRRKLCSCLDPRYLTNEKNNKEMTARSFITERSRKLGHSHTTCEPPSSKKTFRIAAQQIRNGVNHEQAALNLQKQLVDIGIRSMVEVVDLRLLMEPDVSASFDFIVGGIGLAEDILLSAINAIQTNWLPIYAYLDDDMRAYVDKELKGIKRTPDDTAKWEAYFRIEDFLKKRHAIFFLNHRYHTVYEPKNSPYENIALDRNGRVDYRKVWRRTEE